MSLSTREVAQVVLAERGDALIVSSPGWGSCHLVDGAPDDVTVLSQMELGYATPVAMGMAWAQPHRPVIAVDGDGSLVSKLSALADVATEGSSNLIVVVVDNGGYGTFGLSGARPQPVARVRFADSGRSCGVEHVGEVRSPAQLAAQLRIALREPGPWLIVAHADRTDPPVRAEPIRPSVLVTQALRHHLDRAR